MPNLDLSIAIGDYDRVRAISDGEVKIDGIDPTFLFLEPEEIFFRAFRQMDFDVCELSLSSFTVKTAENENPYVGVPVFPSRMFRHSAIVVRTDRIKEPADLKGKRIGLPEYQLTANVWARALLEDEFGVKPADVTWITGGIEQAGRIEKIKLQLPPGVHLEAGPADRTLSQMLESGEIDAVMAPRAPSCYTRGAPNVDMLFPDIVGAASGYFERTRIFPIMHLLGVRRDVAEKNPWLPAALLKAFERAKEIAVERLSFLAAYKVTLPFLEQRVRQARELMGDDFWPYGVEANRHVLETFLRHHHSQGLSSRLVSVEELFHPGTLETFKI